MKIIFLEAVQNYGGARKSTIELASRLQELGHKILIVDFWGCNKPFMEAIAEYKLDLKTLEERESPFIIFNRSKWKYLVNIVKYFFIQIRYKSYMGKIVQEFTPEVINVNNVKCLSILKRNSGYKIDFLARGWFDYKSISFYDKLKYRFYKPRFLTVSQATRQAIYTGGIARLEDIKVLHDVIDSKVYHSFQPEIQPFHKGNPIRILHSGGFLPSKGQHIAVEIAKELRKQGLEFKMVFTGIIYKGEESTNYYKSILKLIKNYELENNLEIVLNNYNIINFFKNSDVLILPSSTEGLPRVCLEALALGKPVIANPAGGITDVVIHNLTGFVTDFNNIPQYVSYIRIYYEDFICYTTHSEFSRKLIKQNYLQQSQIIAIDEIYPL